MFAFCAVVVLFNLCNYVMYYTLPIIKDGVRENKDILNQTLKVTTFVASVASVAVRL